MAKVYMVSEGNYSDYSVEGIFSTRERAELYIRGMKQDAEYSDFNDIDEIELDERIAPFELGLAPFRVFMRKNGDVESCRITRGNNDFANQFQRLARLCIALHVRLHQGLNRVGDYRPGSFPFGCIGWSRILCGGFHGFPSLRMEMCLAW